ncbi:MAG TPA: TauD/TfdA family dioxygenase [Stenomitos sp.]
MNSFPVVPPIALPQPRRGQRRVISSDVDDWVQITDLQPNLTLPKVIVSKVPGLRLVDWVKTRREYLTTLLQSAGGLLFRGFEVADPAAFESFLQSVAGDLLDYRDRSSPRHLVGQHIYTSTDYPADQEIFLHSENSYAATWPLKLAFCCWTAPRSGGETPIADTRKLLQSIDPAIRDRFARLGVMYTRTFGDGMGLSWQEVFQTDVPSEVEAFCQANAIEWEWISDNRLRTRQVRPAITRHPQTREWVWFNHAVFFHITSRPPEIRETLLANFGEAALPHNTYYGDGTPIEPEVLDALRECYHAATVTFTWQEKDVLLLDNMLTAHGRSPFTGDRLVLVGMAQPQTLADSNFSIDFTEDLGV